MAAAAGDMHMQALMHDRPLLPLPFCTQAVEAGGIDIASIVELQSCSAAPPCLSGLLAGS